MRVGWTVVPDYFIFTHQTFRDMYYGELIRKDMKDLPENIKLELYHARLYEDWMTPIETIIGRYASIVVDDEIYLTEEGKELLDRWLKTEDYVRYANGDYHMKLIQCVSSIIKEGKILKNRYGWDYA